MHSLVNSVTDSFTHGFIHFHFSLRDQHGTLKSARKKVLDVMNTLGLTTTVMRLIEKRGSKDKILFWVGVGVTCLIMYLTVWYIRS